MKVTDLKPGDRVMLNCPKAAKTHRQAIFQGIYRSVEEAMSAGNESALLVGAETEKFLREGGSWARFLLQTLDGVSLGAAFVVETDGSLREEMGRRIFIERRLTMGRG
jgi:hypothetical protein